MRSTKGLSQILYLIIAASVLMIAALSIVFMLNNGLEGIIGFGSTADLTACQNQVQSKCATGATSVQTPSSCITENAEGQEEPISGAGENIGVDTTSCPENTESDSGNN